MGALPQAIYTFQIFEHLLSVIARKRGNDYAAVENTRPALYGSALYRKWFASAC